MKIEKILFESPSTSCWRNLIRHIVYILIYLPLLFWLFYRASIDANPLITVMVCVVFVLHLGNFVLDEISKPHRFILTNTHFIIKRRLKDSIIPLQNIKYIRLVLPYEKKRYAKSEVEWSLSFAHYPTSSKKIIYYHRRRDGWTLLATDRGTFLITPDDLQIVDATVEQI